MKALSMYGGYVVSTVVFVVSLVHGVVAAQYLPMLLPVVLSAYGLFYFYRGLEKAWTE